MSIVAEVVQESLGRSSWIRRMFEEGARLKAERGEEAICDFSLGNPILEPPAQVAEALRELVLTPVPGMHRYIPNPGLPAVRAHVAEELAAATGRPYRTEHVVMTCGAAGGLNVLFKALLNPGDEVVALAPYFVEYDFYVANHGGRLVRAATDANFQLDVAALEAALTPRTRAVLVNSPNNPTGVIYPEAALRQMAECLRAASRRFGRPILLVSDEPYRNLVFDGVRVPWLPVLYEHTVLITSHSKDLGLAGERIGYAAVSPDCADAALLFEAMVLANRILGFVNAPALIQRVLPLVKAGAEDAIYYQRLRDRLLPALRKMGLQCVTPQGAFYLFPRAPIPDDVAFVRAALEEGLLLVPGSGFAGPGHFRISLSVPEAVVERALPKFEKVLSQYR
ncbi:MAG: pyridoxal phosphate-dependent aminotransferase [Deltaproteobacteria bacterium]|nr:pyridoxal phosphate-dependent aminotransferase [Deltaproteobacteria bacterium]